MFETIFYVTGGIFWSLVALLLCGVIGVLIWRYFPIRFDIVRDTPSYMHGPYGVRQVKLWIAFSGRKGWDWTFGLMHFGPATKAEILTKKAAK